LKGFEPWTARAARDKDQKWAKEMNKTKGSEEE
jgi:hypothetical protein